MNEEPKFEPIFGTKYATARDPLLKCWVGIIRLDEGVECIGFDTDPDALRGRAFRMALQSRPDACIELADVLDPFEAPASDIAEAYSVFVFNEAERDTEVIGRVFLLPVMDK